MSVTENTVITQTSVRGALILIVDDSQAICDALSLMLQLQGYTTLSCLSPKAALAFIDQYDIALVLQDMNFTQDTTSGEEGKALFYALRAKQPLLPIILLTAWTQLELAVELVKHGAADYMGKPWDDNKLLTSINNLMALQHMTKEKFQLERVNQQRMQGIDSANLCGLVFASGVMQRCVDLALQVATSDVSVLITGPNGAGKDKLADIIHANSFLRDKPFIKVNVGALPVDLLEAELFGAEAGAFTGATKARIGRFEAADGGSLFLDEIGNLPLSGQIKLLRVLQTGEFERLGSHVTRKVKVRVISATNADLSAAIQAGVFREDLFYRLNVIELALAPLSQRQDDILPLVWHFIGADFHLDKQAKHSLYHYSWPGNVRELENACKRAAILAQSAMLTTNDFGITIQAPSTQGIVKFEFTSSKVDRAESHFFLPEQHSALSKTSIPAVSITSLSTPALPIVSKTRIEESLGEHNWVIARVAKSLGLSRQSLYRRMEKYGIEK
ncbi:sigma-54-dependent transcriptional regulator [Shewanella surugensis]|uniref:Sigma-54 dependent transcriptional regulator n=1 Tax=Shewanella surugensis TaxID=212020 RepID=A0ABT0L7C9_9GAMM|nr:sigma-54 dependent transcriptional regulator [Shewanella surugensis]MCL1123267.1 sigma-54 dependent transcriptional regulator [Shewanella surugensis]